MGLTTASLSAL